jgi:hypothetical protein
MAAARIGGCLQAVTPMTTWPNWYFKKTIS